MSVLEISKSRDGFLLFYFYNCLTTDVKKDNTYMHRYNVARSIHHRQPSTDELIAQCMYHTLMLSAQLSSFATGQDTNRCYGGIHGDRGQGSGKDEPGTIATDVVNQRLSSGDVTTDGSIGFAEGSTDNIHLVHDIVTISDTRTAVAIQTHCVDLQIEHGREV